MVDDVEQTLLTLKNELNSRVGVKRPELVYSMKEVNSHCEPSSLWVVIHDQVYDLTHFLMQHPGGMDILLEHGGRDVTNTFVIKGHSKMAHEWLSKYWIGRLAEEDCVESPKYGKKDG